MKDPQLAEFKRELRDSRPKDAVTLVISADKKTALFAGTIGGMPARGVLDTTSLSVDPSVLPAQLERFGEYVSVIEIHKADLKDEWFSPV